MGHCMPCSDVTVDITLHVSTPCPAPEHRAPTACTTRQAFPGTRDRGGSSTIPFNERPEYTQVGGQNPLSCLANIQLRPEGNCDILSHCGSMLYGTLPMCWLEGSGQGFGGWGVSSPT